MSSRDNGPKPNGECVLCHESITPGWDPAKKPPSKWFCSAKCIAESWLEYTLVPSGYWTFDPSLPSCGPERIKLAEDWIESHNEGRGGRPGLLLHSRVSGTGKTRVATHIATLQIMQRWGGPEEEKYLMRRYEVGPAGVWLNARRFRQTYQGTLHFSKAADRESWVDCLCHCQLLVLDEPDKLKPSEGLVEVIYSVLDERFANDKLTILTTNIGGQELARRWGPQHGPYLVRRIREFCLAINFDP